MFLLPALLAALAGAPDGDGWAPLRLYEWQKGCWEAPRLDVWINEGPARP